MDKIGLQVIFQNYGSSIPDVEHVKNEIEIAQMAEPLGMDEVWSVEQHFTDYSTCPDNTQFLAYLAGITSRVKLATAAIVLPWNDPIRTAEKIAFLDHLSDGRAIFGAGMDLSANAYYRKNQEQNLDDNCESFAVVLEALKSGFVKDDRDLSRRTEVEIRPRPISSWKNRFYSSVTSIESVAQSAQLGAQIVLPSNLSIERMKVLIDIYNYEYSNYHIGPAKLPRLCDYVVCHENSEQASVLAKNHIGGYFASVMDNFELIDGREKSPCWSSMDDGSSESGEENFETVVDDYIACNLHGTPEDIIDKARDRQLIIGDYEQTICVRFGGIDQRVAMKSLELFMKYVVPELRGV